MNPYRANRVGAALSETLQCFRENNVVCPKTAEQVLARRAYLIKHYLLYFIITTLPSAQEEETPKGPGQMQDRHELTQEILSR